MNFDAFANVILFEMRREPFVLTRFGIDDQRMRRAEDEEVPQRMSANIQSKGFAALSRLKRFDCGGGEIVQKRRAVVAGDFKLRPIAAIDEAGAGGQSSVFRIG